MRMPSGIKRPASRWWRYFVAVLSLGMMLQANADCDYDWRQAKDAMQRVQSILIAFDGSGPPPVALDEEFHTLLTALDRLVASPECHYLQPLRLIRLRMACRRVRALIHPNLRSSFMIQRQIDEAQRDHTFYAASHRKHRDNFQRGVYKTLAGLGLSAIPAPMVVTPVVLVDMVTDVFTPKAKPSTESFVVRHRDEILAESRRRFQRKFPHVDIDNIKKTKHRSAFIFTIRDVIQDLTLAKKDQAFERTRKLIAKQKEIEKKIETFLRHQEEYKKPCDKYLPQLGTWKKTKKPPPPKPGIQIKVTPDNTLVEPGDSVSYRYQISNTGNVALEHWNVVHDHCRPIAFISGDKGGDQILSPGESWRLHCVAAVHNDIQGWATVTAATADGNSVTHRIRVEVKVHSGPCRPPQLAVPYLLYQQQDEALNNLAAAGLRGWVAGNAHSTSFMRGQVMRQTPVDDSCVAPGSTVELILSKGPEPDDRPPDTPGRLSVSTDCPSAFEVTPGGRGRDCKVIVRGWRSRTTERVYVWVDYSGRSGLRVTPLEQSELPSNMYTGGVTASNAAASRYVFWIAVKANGNAAQGRVPVTVRVGQQGAGEAAFSVEAAILPKGQRPATGGGVRPPATVTVGSGGPACVWRHQNPHMPPNCFEFVAAACRSTIYRPPRYESVGQDLSWAEADAVISRLSPYAGDAYGCNRRPSGGQGGVDSDGDGVPDPQDGCPHDKDKITAGACGCGKPDKDSDGDDVFDCVDGCPYNRDKQQEGACGCRDQDSDGDGVCDRSDQCPGKDDIADRDRDGTPDCQDGCPKDPQKVTPGPCDCGDRDTDQDGICDRFDKCPGEDDKADRDGDRVADCLDGCPDDPLKRQPGTAGCGQPEPVVPACPANSTWVAADQSCYCNRGYEVIGGQCVRECPYGQQRGPDGRCSGADSSSGYDPGDDPGMGARPTSGHIATAGQTGEGFSGGIPPPSPAGPGDPASGSAIPQGYTQASTTEPNETGSEPPASSGPGRDPGDDWEQWGTSPGAGWTASGHGSPSEPAKPSDPGTVGRASAAGGGGSTTGASLAGSWSGSVTFPASDGPPATLRFSVADNGSVSGTASDSEESVSLRGSVTGGNIRMSGAQGTGKDRASMTLQGQISATSASGKATVASGYTRQEVLGSVAQGVASGIAGAFGGQTSSRPSPGGGTPLSFSGSWNARRQ